MSDQQWFIFTFGVGQEHEGKYVKVFGSFGEARKKMIYKYGRNWGFQYTASEWADWLANKPAWFPAETLLEEIK